MTEISEYVAGRAFFPGGTGLWHAQPGDGDLPAMPDPAIMLVGQDFDCEVGYRHSLAAGMESISESTWRNLLALLADAGIRPDNCFFTNAIMGIRRGDEAVGESPGYLDVDFRSRCAQFLRAQITCIRPRAVIALGLPAARVLGLAIPALSRLADLSTFPRADAEGLQYADSIFLDIAPPPDRVHFRFAALTHPCYRHINAKRREFRGVRGHLAEVALLRAIAQA